MSSCMFRDREDGDMATAVVESSVTAETPTLQDLVDKKYLGSIPEGDWKYNPETGELGE